MSQESIAQLLKSVRESIQRAESSSGPHRDERIVKLVLAHLWSAYDELELIAAQRVA
jgi:hypothetical protein